MTTDDTNESLWRTLGWTLSVLFWVLAIVLLCLPMSIGSESDGPSAEATTCDAVLTPVLPFLGEDGNASPTGVREYGDLESDAASACAARRDVLLTGSVLLLAPATILVSVLAATRGRPRAPQRT